MLKFLYSLILLVTISCVSEDEGKINLNSKSNFFKPKEIFYLESLKKIEIDNLIQFAKENKFKLKKADYFSFGITTNLIYIYFDISHEDYSEWILELPYPPLTQITVYQVDSYDNIYSHSSGFSYPSHEKYSEHPFYQFPIIAQRGIIRIYLELAADDPLVTAIFFWNKNILNQIDGYRHLTFGIFFGIILSLALYNLLLFTIIKDRTYLYYVGYILSYGIFLFFLYGYLGYLNRNFLVRFPIKIMPLFATLTSLFACLFSRRFLNISEFSTVLNRMFQILIIVGFVFAIIFFITPPKIGAILANLHPILGVGLILISSIIAIKNNYKPAIYFLIAWSGLLFSVTCYIGSNLTIFPSNFFTNYLQIPGVAFEAILLSLALGYRINDLRNREEDTRQKALQKEIASREQQEKLSLSFKRFVPGEFLKNLNKESILDIRQGDSVSCRMSVLFTDIRGFTNLSEKVESEKVFSFLNEYLEKMEPIIQKHEGFIDKFIGDAIMALFPDEEKSVLAALEMILIANQFYLPDNSSLEIGIGIHTGELILGTIGSPSRIDTTVIGDTVNLASRIESLNKQYGTKVLVSGDVVKNGKSEIFIYREIDLVRVKGKEKPILIYEILGNLL